MDAVIIGTSWTYTINGQGFMGTYEEDYCLGMYETTRRISPTAAVQVIRLDRVASDFATTGKNWTVKRTVVLDSHPTDTRTVAEMARDAAFLAEQAGDPYGDPKGTSPYFNDAYALLDNLFRVARERHGARGLGVVVAAFERLAQAEGDRVHRLLISLKRGRTFDVLDGLLAY